MGLENTEAAGRQCGLCQVAGREAVAVDVPVKHQCCDGRVGVHADAGEWPCVDDLDDVCGEAGAGRRLGCGRAEFDVFGPVEGLYWAAQACGARIVEDELPDAGSAAFCGAVSEFGPAEQAGDLGVSRFGGDVGGWSGLA